MRELHLAQIFFFSMNMLKVQILIAEIESTTNTAILLATVETALYSMWAAEGSMPNAVYFTSQYRERC